MCVRFVCLCLWKLLNMYLCMFGCLCGSRLMFGCVCGSRLTREIHVALLTSTHDLIGHANLPLATLTVFGHACRRTHCHAPSFVRARVYARFVGRACLYTLS